MSSAAGATTARFRLLLGSAFWPLADQGLVSVCTFATTLMLARGLAPQEYGVFGLLFMAMLQVQIFTSTLLLYPLCILGTVLDAPERARLFGTGLVLSLACCIPLGAILAAGLYAAGRLDLVAPTIAWLVPWQIQELLRRGLFTQLRHSAAIPGDLVRYGGQGAAVAALGATGALTLAHVVTAMALAAAAGAAVQAWQFRIEFANLAAGRQILRESSRIGIGSLGSNLLSTLSVQLFPWFLAASGGTVLSASFQALLNVVTAVNPVLIGLCNIIPQTIARERLIGGVRHAWRASRSLMIAGCTVVFGFYSLVALWPETVLAALYGNGSPYTELTLPLRAMAAAAIIAFAVEMVNAFMHGIQRTRLSLRINATGLAVATLVGVPLTVAIGITGSCLGMIAANATRMVTASRMLGRVLNETSRLRR